MNLSKHLCSFLFFVAIANSIFAQASVEKLQTALNSIYEAHPESIGLMVHVEAPEQKISQSFAVGFSEKNGKTPIDPTAPALIASNVKTYMAAAILRLVEMGKITTNQPIKKLISKKSKRLLKKDGYDLNAITVANLLSHTSGIHDYIDQAYMDFVSENPKHRWTREEQIALSVKIGKPLGAPGDVFQYADVNFLLIGEILERFTGKPFYTAVRELVDYKKLGLTDTWFAILEGQPKNTKPLVHQYWGEMNYHSYEIDPSFDLYGAGGIGATTKDLAMFSQSLFTGKVIQNESVLNQIFTPAKTKDGKDHHYHFGLSSSEIEGFQAYGHGGFWGTVVQYFPELNASVSVFVLERDKRILRKDILEAIVPILAGKDATPEKRITSEIDSTYGNELVLIQTFDVNVSVDSVWNAYTTKRGWESAFVSQAEVDWKVNGTIKTRYDTTGIIGEPGTIVLNIENYVPKKLITFKANISDNFPEFMKKDAADFSNVITLESLEPTKTRVVSYGIGYKNTPKYMNLMKFFIQGNEMSYLNFIKYLEKGRGS